MVIYRCDWCRATHEMTRVPKETSWLPEGWVAAILRADAFATGWAGGPRFDFCSAEHQEEFVRHVVQTAGADPHDHRSSR